MLYFNVLEYQIRALNTFELYYWVITYLSSTYQISSLLPLILSLVFLPYLYNKRVNDKKESCSKKSLGRSSYENKDAKRVCRKNRLQVIQLSVQTSFLHLSHHSFLETNVSQGNFVIKKIKKANINDTGNAILLILFPL